MLVFDLHLAVAAFDEFRNQLHRAGAIKRDQRRDVFDGTDLKFAAQIAHPAGFQLEYAERFRAIEQVVGFLVIERQVVDWHFDAVRAPDHFARVADDRERLQTEKIHLQQAEVTNGIHRVLRDERAAFVLLERQQIHERLVADDDAGGVDGGVARDVFKDERGVNQLARDLLGFVSLLEFRRLLERLRQIHFQIDRNHLRQPVALAVTQTHHAPHVAHDGFRTHRAERDDLRDGFAPVFFTDILNDIGAPVVGKINVNVRRVDTLGVEEPLEQQAVTDRVHVGNLQQVGDDGTSGGTARHTGNAVFVSVTDEIADDEKVTDETGFLDDRELQFQPVHHGLDGGSDGGIIQRASGILPEVLIFLRLICRQDAGSTFIRRQPFWIVNALNDKFLPLGAGVNRVAPEQAFRDQFAQITFAREMFRRRKNREMQFAKLNLQVALLGDFERVPDRLGRVGEARLHFLRRAQVKLLRLVAHPFRVGQLRLRADANQAIVRVRMAFLDVMNVIRRDEFEAEFLRPLDQMLVDLRLFRDAVVLQFEVKILRAERLLEPIHRVARLVQLVFEDPIRDFARQAAGHRDQAFLVRGQDFLVNARLVIIALQMRGGGELDQVFVAGFVLRQQS